MRRCGAAVGDLDADSLFYLQARGIPLRESEARGLLLQAFLGDAVAEIADAGQREHVRGEVLAALGAMS